MQIYVWLFKATMKNSGPNVDLVMQTELKLMVCPMASPKGCWGKSATSVSTI